MCTLCLVAFGAIVAALAPGSARTFQQQKINEFQALVETYLPPGARGAEARDRMAERLTQMASAPAPSAPTDWKSCVPFFRPNEARLKARAEWAAQQTFSNVRAAILAGDSALRNQAAARTVSGLAEFYTNLATYDGDRANRLMKRAFTLLGPTVVPVVLIGSGAYLASFPEICGAIPGPLGSHAHHVLLGVGSAGALGMMGLAVTKRGQDWLIENGTHEQDRNAGAHRAEVYFWKRISELWGADSELPSLLTNDTTAIANSVFRRLNWTGEGVLGACEDFLSEAPACHACAAESQRAG